MSPSDLRAAVLAAGGSVDDLTSGPDWQMCATLPRERLRLLADAARIAWAYEEDFDRWASSRDAVTPLPRDAEQFTMLVIAPDGTRYADPSGPARARPSQQDLLMEIARIRNLAP